MIEVTVAARSEGVDQIQSIRCCCCMRPLLRMPADNKTKGAHVCAAWTGRGRRQIGRSGRHAARGMFKALPASDLRAGTAAQLLPVTSVDLPAQRRTARMSQVSIFVQGRRRSTPTLHKVLLCLLLIMYTTCVSDVGSLIPLALAVESIVCRIVVDADLPNRRSVRK